MKKILLLICFLNQWVLTSGQDSTHKIMHSIGVDVMGVFNPLNANTALRYQVESKSYLFRSNFQFQYSSRIYDTSGNVSRTIRLVPYLGLAKLVDLNKFSFFAGADIYYEFESTKINGKQPNPALDKIYKYGICPVLGLRYKVNKKFSIQLESLCKAAFVTTDYRRKGTTITTWNFSLFNQYAFLFVYTFN